jgi:hypothetical protein
VLCELAGWTAFLAAGLMIVAGFTSDSSRIDVMSVAPAFAFSMICIAGADHLFEPDLGRG